MPDVSRRRTSGPVSKAKGTAGGAVETDQNQNYTLGDWFLLWGHAVNSQSQAIFNRTQIFNNKVDATHHITMTVNGANDTTDYQNLQFPRNAGTTADCAVPGGGCQPFNVIITY